MDNIALDAEEINVSLQKSLNKVAKREGFEDFDISIKEIDPDGNNYLAVLREITIKSTNNDQKQLDLFVKVKEPNIGIDQLSVSDVYNREMFVGLKLSRIYEDLQNEANIPIDERYKFLKYYEETNSDFIIMDNMKKKGFTMHDRLEVISIEYAELCIKQLAKFHALSYVFKSRQPQFYEKTLEILKYPIDFNGDWDVFLDKMFRSHLEYLDDIAKMKLEKAIPTLNIKHKYFIQNSDSIKCLCHGDFRTCNILQIVKDEAVIEVVPIDYQTIHCGSPINDLLYLIFGATDREFRRKHLEDLKNLYYNTVEQFLKYFSMDVEDFCPRTEFERIYNDRLNYGLSLALFFVPLILIEDDEYPDFTKISEVKMNNKSDRVKLRIKDIVQDFIEWGYL